MQHQLLCVPEGCVDFAVMFGANFRVCARVCVLKEVVQSRRSRTFRLKTRPCNARNRRSHPRPFCENVKHKTPLTNHQPLFCRLNLMRQTLYINMRSRSSLRAERAKTSRITTMATRTFLKTSNNKNPLTSHQLLLRCSQVKSVVT